MHLSRARRAVPGAFEAAGCLRKVDTPQNHGASRSSLCFCTEFPELSVSLWISVPKSVVKPSSTKSGQPGPLGTTQGR